MKNDVDKLADEVTALIERMRAHASDEVEQHRVQIDGLKRELASRDAVITALTKPAPLPATHNEEEAP